MLRHFESRTEKAVFVTVFAFFVFVIGTTLASVAAEIGRPAPGFVVWPNLVVPAIGAPDWPGTRAGIPLRSVLREVGGHPIRTAAELRALVRAVPVGTTLTYDFLHDGATVRVAVPTTVLRWRDVVLVYGGYLFDGLAFLASGLVVFYFKPRLPAARAALAVGAAIGLDLVLALELFSGGWLQHACFIAESMMPGALLHFGLCFPEPKPLARRRPSVVVLAYLPSVVLAALQNVYLASEPAAHLLVNDWVYDATAAAGLFSVLSLVHAYYSSASALARQQAKVVMAGVTLAAFVPSLGLLSITVLGLDLPMNVLTPFFFVYPVSIAYAIARHDLFAVDRYLRLGVVYATLSVFVFVSYAGVVLGARTWMGAGRTPPAGVVPVYIVAVLLLFEPVRSRLQRLVDRLFYRQVYSYRATVEAASRTLASVLETDRIAMTVLATLTDVMAIEWGVLLLVDPGPGPRAYALPPERAHPVLAAFAPGDPAVAAVAARERPLSTYTMAADSRRHRQDVELARFAALGAALVVPVRFQAEPVGVVLAGEKRSGAFFGDEDLDLLDTLVHQAAVALTNARAYEVIRRTQAELVEAERLAAVGELAAAVAHGIRNPLAGIRAVAQLAREDVEPGSDLAESLDDIVGEADRLEQRVRTILDVTRPLEPKLVCQDVHRFLEELTTSVASRVPAGVRLAFAPGPIPLAATFDRVHLTEVLETIVVNAVEAMGTGGGTVTIRTGLEQADAGLRAVIAVRDSGPGIDDALMARVFDLFYTTKPSGTGVGLAMAKRLVERQNGTLEVANPPGGGAEFSIRLPAAPAVT